jgi:hypothetical protein
MGNFNLTDLRLFLAGLRMLLIASDELDKPSRRLSSLIEDVKKLIEHKEKTTKY